MATCWRSGAWRASTKINERRCIAGLRVNKSSPRSSCAKAMTCRMSDGDLLDTICHNYYRYPNGSVEAALDANPGLVGEEQSFHTGLIIVQPDLSSPVTEDVNLWTDSVRSRRRRLIALHPSLNPLCAGSLSDAFHDPHVSHRRR